MPSICLGGSNLRDKSFIFWLLSRFYWALSSLFVVSIIVCNAVAAGMAASPDFSSHQQSVLILSVISAILVGVKNVAGFAENSAVCRDISRSLDSLAQDYKKGRLNDDQVEKRIVSIRRRVPIGSCVFLRVS